jgi:hypothetical protein
LFIPWGCDTKKHVCPQYAADVSNQQFRAWWIGKAKEYLGRGAYKGLWIDDVNLDFRAGDGDGRPVVPVDPATGAPMTEENWRRYLAEFVEQIRNALPGVEIVHNSVWYSGGQDRDRNPFVEREIAAADVINIEHGVNDPNLKGGSGAWSFEALLSFIDRVQARGKAVVIDGIGGASAGPAAVEFGVASYYLVSNGRIFAGDPGSVTGPESIWPGFTVDLGRPVGTRTKWTGVYRRDFQSGFVLVNPPAAPAAQLNLPGGCKRPDGTTISSLVLQPRQGAICLNTH